MNFMVKTKKTADNLATDVSRQSIDLVKKNKILHLTLLI